MYRTHLPGGGVKGRRGPTHHLGGQSRIAFHNVHQIAHNRIRVRPEAHDALGGFRQGRQLQGVFKALQNAQTGEFAGGREVHGQTSPYRVFSPSQRRTRASATPGCFTSAGAISLTGSIQPLSRSKSARRNCISPVWRVPSTSPGPRISRSFSAIKKPSWLSRRACRRALPLFDSGGWYMSTQKLAWSPRPTRPRNWCSWARPSRSGFSMIISDALGTSTPTSITVVATSKSSSPFLKRSITSAFSWAFRRPCTRPTLRSDKRSESSWAVTSAAWHCRASDSSTSVHTQ